MKALLSALLLITTLLTGCFNSQETKAPSTGQNIITSKQKAQEAVSLLQGMRLDALAQGVSSASGINPSQVNSQATTTYPIPYSIHRDCNISGTADTEGEKISDTEYDADNTFTSCQHIPGIIVNGVNHVYAQLNGDNLYAEMSDGEIGVTIGSLNLEIYSLVKFYSNRDFTRISIILDGDVPMYDASNSYEATFSDFNVSMDTENKLMQMNGNISITACGKENFTIETIEPLTPALNGTFTAGKLKINGAVFDFNDDKTVTVTLADNLQYTLVQGIDAMCTLESGSTLIGSVRDAVSSDLLEDVNISAVSTTGIYAIASDSHGNFKFRDLAAGDYSLEFVKNGYITADANFTVHENVEENFGLINLIPSTVADQNISFSGVVKNGKDGTAVDAVTLVIHSGYNNPTGTIVATLTSDANGNFSTEIPTGDYTLELSKNGFITSNNISVSLAADAYKELTLTPVISATEAVITLTWGGTPSDLDSHLQKANEYHVYYGNKSVSLASGETASLDTDDTSSYGPETITLDNLDQTATYTYSVYNYSNEGPLSTSEAVVTVNFGSDTFTFRPPNQEGRTWTVFTVDNGNLIPCTGTCIQ